MAKTKNNEKLQLSVLDHEQKLINKAQTTLQNIKDDSKHEGIVSVVFKRLAVSAAAVVALAGGGYAVFNHTVPTVESPQVAFTGEWYEANADGTFTGFFEDGKYNGFGTYEFLTGETYSGNWDNDQYSGQGKMMYPDYGIYEGNYEDGVRSGDGTFTWNNGDVYTGQWSNDEMNGTGTLTYANGFSISGSFEGNSFSNCQIEIPVADTTGTLTLAKDGYTLDFTQNGISYSLSINGEGNLSGTGSINYPNGDSFTGDIISGKKFSGTYSFSNGDGFHGSFVNDMMSSGTYTFKNGNKLKGNFDNGVPNGTLDYYANSKSYTTTWANGRCTGIKKA